MKKTALFFAAVCLLGISKVSAQAPLEASPVGPPPNQPVELSQRGGGDAPYYSRSSSRRASAREAIHMRAAYKAAQRTQRIEAMKWFGYSRQRPPSPVLPWMGSTSAWIGGAVVYHHYPGVFYPRTAAVGPVQQ